MLRKKFEETQAELQKIPLNAVRISTLDVGGPYSQVMGPSRDSADKIYTCGHRHGEHQRWCVSRIMTDLACRAYPPSGRAGEIEKLVALVHTAQEEEDSFDEGLAVGIQAVLVSPDFLFRIERDHAAGPDVDVLSDHPARAGHASVLLPVGQHAGRRAASRGRRRDVAGPAGAGRAGAPHAARPEGRARWRRISAASGCSSARSSRSRATRRASRISRTTCGSRCAARRELFVEHVIRDDRSILDFLDGKYSYLNERLARHYGIPNVVGPEFRRVDLTGSPRGGVLTQGSVLTVSSYATRTSPVLRGKWILDNLLNAPPPDPPPNVPNLDESAIGTAHSMRQQLEAHRKDPTCAACHRRMDPLGFGLENFDAVGAWRTTDGKFPIDASGFLPDGDEFNGPDELRTILEGQKEAFARCLTSKLMIYALGRGLERYDNRTVKSIAKRLAPRRYRFSSLVLDIVKSLPFQSRRPA